MNHYQLSDAILYRKQGKTGTLFNPSSGKIFSIDEVGRAIVDFLSTPKSMEQIENHIKIHFAINSDTSLHDDIVKFLNELESLGLFE